MVILADVERALKTVLDTKQLGSPVALRLHAVLPDFHGELWPVLGWFLPVVRLVSQETAGQVLARQHGQGRHVSLLWTDSSGRTVNFSLAAIPQARQSLQLLVVGNHGLTRLSGGDSWSETPPAEMPPLWQSAIRESLQTGRSVVVGSVLSCDGESDSTPA